jgi:hypothetical protein
MATRRPPAEPIKTQLTQPVAEARSKIETRIEIGKQLLVSELGDPLNPLIVRRLDSEHKIWTEYNAELLRNLFTTEERAQEYEQCPPIPEMSFGDLTGVDIVRRTHDCFGAELQCLESIQTRLGLYTVVTGAATPVDAGRPSPLEVLGKTSDRFHLVARQLLRRHSGRPTLSVSDEYDVQDLLHALLLVEFEDVRPEEYTPSYAGGSARMDFLLKNEQIVVEVKCTREGLAGKEVGDQLLIDIGRYRVHQDCKALFCFVYDPEARIRNPRGLESDLSNDRHGLPTRVRIRPRS